MEDGLEWLKGRVIAIDKSSSLSIRSNAKLAYQAKRWFCTPESGVRVLGLAPSGFEEYVFNLEEYVLSPVHEVKASPSTTETKPLIYMNNNKM